MNRPSKFKKVVVITLLVFSLLVVPVVPSGASFAFAESDGSVLGEAIESTNEALIQILIQLIQLLQEQIVLLLEAQGVPNPTPSSIPETDMPTVNLMVCDEKCSNGPLTKKPGYTTFKWTSKDITSCVASGDVAYWSGSKSTNGSQRIWVGNEKYGMTTYKLTCANKSGLSTSDNITIYFDYSNDLDSSPSITVTYPNGGEQLSIGAGKDVDFRVKWTSSDLSGTADVYLNSNNGDNCLLGSVPVSQGEFLVTHKNYGCQNMSSSLSTGEYIVSIETDTQKSSGKNVNDMGNGYFNITAQ